MLLDKKVNNFVINTSNFEEKFARKAIKHK